MRVAAAFVLCSTAGLFLGCTSVDISPTETREITAKQLGIDPSSLVVQTPARFAVMTARARYADFTSGVYTQTRTEIVLLGYDSAAKTFSRDYSIGLRDIQSLSVLTTGMFSHIQQVQIALTDKIVVLDYTNDPNADGGYRESTKPVIDGLMAAGVTHRESASLARPDLWVIPSELQYYSAPIPIIKK